MKCRLLTEPASSCDNFNQGMFETVLWCTNAIRADIHEATGRNNEIEKVKKIDHRYLSSIKVTLGIKLCREIMSKKYLRMA